jgi:hypothetical protein
MNAARIPHDLLLAALRGQAVVSAAELREAFAAADLSPSTLQRTVAAAGRSVLRFGGARSTRYALTRNVLGAGTQWPLTIVDPSGIATPVGTLYALQEDHWAVQTNANAPAYALLGSDRGIFYGLPWYLSGFRPDGFTGRNLVHEWATVLGAPADLRDWSWDNALIAAARGVVDPPGNWMISDVSRRNKPPTVSDGERAVRYEQLAAASIAGEPVGSSAGGEQPKFTVIVDLHDGPQELIVKFSPPRDQPAGRRWADLLVCEHLAAELLRENAIATSTTALVEAGARLCLEVERFDRVGTGGRRGTCLLSAIVPTLGGPSNSWTAATEFLLERELVASDTLDRVELLEAFGTGIGNTDRHLGNLSLMLDGGPPFDLAPVYDMLPMLYRPTTAGELVERDLQDVPVVPQARALAVEFWNRVASHPLISEAFGRIAEDNAAAVAPPPPRGEHRLSL